MRKISSVFLSLSLLAFGGCSAVQRKLLFHPTHHEGSNGLAAWKMNGDVIGYSREVSNPENIWLLLHGNGGQAADRTYALPSFSSRDSVFILEYPGYGSRAGQPSKASLDAAAIQGYQFLKRNFRTTPVCVAGESIGSGPACILADQPQPPAKIVLVVPFDTIERVAADHVSFLPTHLILGPTWNNVQALSDYKGPVEIFGATRDTVIKIEHAKILADHVSLAKFHVIEGGHNEWSAPGRVTIRNP